MLGARRNSWAQYSRNPPLERMWKVIWLAKPISIKLAFFSFGSLKNAEWRKFCDVQLLINILEPKSDLSNTNDFYGRYGLYFWNHIAVFPNHCYGDHKYLAWLFEVLGKMFIVQRGPLSTTNIFPKTSKHFWIYKSQF